MTDSVNPRSNREHLVPLAPIPGVASTVTETAAASNDAFLSTGLSPGQSQQAKPSQAPPVTTLHLIGPGQVGRAFLQQLQARQLESLRLVAVSDRSGTVFQREGLAVTEIVTHKHRGGRLSELDGAETIPTELAIRLVSADIVVDATPSTAEDTDAAVLRGRAALQCGAVLALCSKNGLAEAAAEWLAPATRKRVFVNAVLGGTGAQLLAELDELRRDCHGLALVGNVTTTAIIAAIEAGASIEQGIEEARRLGFLEPDATLDLDGSDAATKLLCVWSALFGSTFTKSPGLGSVRREDVRELDPEVLRERTSRGATTRLIARGGRSGADLRVAFDEVALGSPLAAPADRVVYGYELPSGLRVHTGLGVGYARTAEALWVDVNKKLQEATQ
ncbi:MAG: homoserine dehydrogenase [Planctomycetota bacterium]|jgi:homoserine dehydrogenase